MTRPWREPLAVAFAAGVLVGAYAWLSRLGIDLVDEGYFLDLGSRVLRGQVPYRDFDTYYTPGMFYLEAAALATLGANVLTTRGLILLIRLGCGLLLYRLARRVAAPRFAAVPALLLAGLGVVVGSSPGWPALLASLLMLEALAAHARVERGGWLLGLAGASAGLAFAFKQNVGAFALLGALGYVVLRQRPGAGAVLLALRLAYAGGLAWSARSFLAPSLDEWLAAAVWLPLVSSLGLLIAWCGRPTARALGGLAPLAADAGCLMAGFGLVTLVWLVPLVGALGVQATPFALFLGSVKQGALAFPLEAPPRAAGAVALVALWAPLGLAFAFGLSRSRLVWPLAVAAQGSLVIGWLPTRVAPADPLTSRPSDFPRLESLSVDLGSLYLYLAPLAAWTGLLLLAHSRRGPSRPPLVAWYLLVGALAELAMYPRADTPHALLAGAPLLVVGAWVLARVHAALAGRCGVLAQAAMFAALLVTPAAATLPHVYRAYIAVAHPLPEAAAVEYVPLGLARAPVLLPRPQAEALRDAVAYIQARTRPGEPIFAYPVDPLVNFLADRPNPTRFDHLMPGALTLDDMREAMASLEAARPRYVFWDHGAVVFWGTDHPNRPMSDYIWRCYRQVATFGLYLVLERTPDCQTSTSPL